MARRPVILWRSIYLKVSDRKEALIKEALNTLIPFTPFDRLKRAFDKLPPAAARAGTTNGINRLPFVLGLSKDLNQSFLNELGQSRNWTQ